MIGIYKITNIVNQKVYIGQSQNISRRWRRHRTSYQKEDTILYRAMRKYGLNNFTFEVVEECLLDELNNKEKYWIQYFDSCNRDKGYNMNEGGNVIGKNAQLSKKQILEIISLLKTTSVTQRQIAKDYNVSEYVINKINSGDSYVQQGIEYPVRPFIKKKNYCCECGIEISRNAIRCPECAHKKRQKVEHPSREELKLLIRTKPFTEIGRLYQVSDNAVRKWCDKYELPRKSSDIKKISKKDWDLI